MEKINIAIIGCGSRGISVLERIITLYSSYCQGKEIKIWLIDKDKLGFGVHRPEQPDYFLANTVACQITMFGDDTLTDAGKIRKGPDFWQWACTQDAINPDGFFSDRKQEKLILPDDYLPRKMLGNYLHYVYLSIIHDLPQEITVQEIHGQAVQISTFSNHKIKIKIDTGFKLKVDYLFLSTGHGDEFPTEDEEKIQRFVSEKSRQNTALRYISRPYDLNNYSKISSANKVLIEGIGLTTYDIISNLTCGRGGQFSDCDGRLIYHPSGNEPDIYIYSRQALPAGSRGVNQKGSSGQYLPHFFTRGAIDRLRTKTPEGKIDFVTDLLPLLTKEMSYVYRCVQQDEWLDAEDYHAGQYERDAINQLFYPHHNLIFPNLKSYRNWFKVFLKADIAEAEKGNVYGGLKAAADVIRDTRDIIRYAVNYGGLTPQSHRQFLHEFCPIFNRISVGPPLRRNKELLALLEGGVVTLGAGPRPQLVCQNESNCFALNSTFLYENSVTFGDVLVKAHIPSFSPIRDNSLLYHNLLMEGVIRPYDNGGFRAGGIDIDRQHHVINRKKISQKNIYAIGNPVEGANFYTYILPRPAVNSTALKEAALCVIDMYKNICQHPVR